MGGDAPAVAFRAAAAASQAEFRRRKDCAATPSGTPPPGPSASVAMRTAGRPRDRMPVAGGRAAPRVAAGGFPGPGVGDLISDHRHRAGGGGGSSRRGFAWRGGFGLRLPAIAEPGGGLTARGRREPGRRSPNLGAEVGDHTARGSTNPDSEVRRSMAGAPTSRPPGERRGRFRGREPHGVAPPPRAWSGRDAGGLAAATRAVSPSPASPGRLRGGPAGGEGD